MIAKDRRIRLASETFEAIKFIKANAFEEHFYDRIDKLREKELKIIFKKYLFQDELLIS